MKKWCVVFDPYCVPELSYNDTLTELLKVISKEPCFSSHTYIDTPYMDMMNIVWDQLNENSKILIQTQSDNYKDCEYVNVKYDECISSGKILKKSHNLYKLWAAGALK